MRHRVPCGDIDCAFCEDGWRPAGRFDVWVGEERIYAAVNDSWSARWLAGNFAPEARPTI